jgi:hypothetical protein
MVAVTDGIGLAAYMFEFLPVPCILASIIEGKPS